MKTIIGLIGLSLDHVLAGVPANAKKIKSVRRGGQWTVVYGVPA